MKRKIKQKIAKRKPVLTDKQMIDIAIKNANVPWSISEQDGKLLATHHPSYLNREKEEQISPGNTSDMVVMPDGLTRIEAAVLKFELAINAAIHRLNKLV